MPAPLSFGVLCRGWTQSSKHMPSRLSVITGSVSFGANRIPVSPPCLLQEARPLCVLPWAAAWGMI